MMKHKSETLENIVVVIKTGIHFDRVFVQNICAKVTFSLLGKQIQVVGNDLLCSFLIRANEHMHEQNCHMNIRYPIF